MSEMTMLLQQMIEFVIEHACSTEARSVTKSSLPPFVM